MRCSIDPKRVAEYKHNQERRSINSRYLFCVIVVCISCFFFSFFSKNLSGNSDVSEGCFALSGTLSKKFRMTFLLYVTGQLFDKLDDRFCRPQDSAIPKSYGLGKKINANPTND